MNSRSPPRRSGAGVFARWRDSILPDRAERLWSLAYLCFLFLNWDGRGWRVWLVPTVLSVVAFLPAYLVALRDCSNRDRMRLSALIALLGFALVPINTGGNTYLIYAGALVGSSSLPLRRSVQLIVSGLAVYFVELSMLDWPRQYVVLSVAVTGVLAIAIAAANYHHREKRLRQAELTLSHDEVRRLAALAERERIGRDLHDLLGHTLSLITLKSELATRLFDRDPLGARREMADVERVARDALGQVRRAVSGIRSAGLAAELASARLLLESSDVRLDYALDGAILEPAAETVFALVVREAITNVQRHAHARRARVEVACAPGEVRLSISDDGVGAVIVPGNGLAGVRERLQLLGGRLEIASARGQGTRLVAALPMAMAETGALVPWHDD